MTLDELVSTGTIDRQGADLYMLYRCTELGQKVLADLEKNIFMEEPQGNTGVKYGESEGRKSVVRDIKRIIDFINSKLQEQSDV